MLTLQEHHHENSASKIAFILGGLLTAYGFTAPPRTVLIEVAFDLWPKHDPKTIYSAITALKSRWALYGEDARQVMPDRSVKNLYELANIVPESTLCIGWHTDKYWNSITPISGKAYPKITDGLDEDEEPIPLPPSQHRARVEVTLQGVAVEKFGLTDPLTLGSYDFTRFAELLHFQMFKSVDEIRQDRLDKYRDDWEQAVAELQGMSGPG